MKTCISCFSKDRKWILDKYTVSLFKCSACGVVYQDQWEDCFVEYLYNYYESRFGLKKDEVYNPINGLRNLNFLSQFRRGKLLDVGCGEGQMVHDALQLGWDAKGIDLSRSAVSICNKFNLPCKNIDFFDSELDGERFNLIYMSELIEHVPRPGNFLSRAEELLEKNGILYITTPNFYSLTRIILGSAWRPIHPEHLSYFTSKTIKKIIEKNTKFKIIRICSENLDIFSIKNYFFRSKKETLSFTNIRAEIEKSFMLKFFKNITNKTLSGLGVGDSLKITCKRVQA